MMNDITGRDPALVALAERCEAATGPDRELDRDIAIEMFDGGADHLDDARDVTRARKVLISHGARPENFEVVGFSGVSLRSPDAYTSDLNAAMSLVPKGLILRRYMATKYVPHSCEVAISYGHGGWVGNSDHSFALGLCAAALRSHAQGIETRSAKTEGLGPQDESPVTKSCAQGPAS